MEDGLPHALGRADVAKGRFPNERYKVDDADSGAGKFVSLKPANRDNSALPDGERRICDTSPLKLLKK